MTTRFAFLALLATACFNPKFKDHVNCGANGECPPDQQCGTDGKCHTAGEFDAPIDSSQIDSGRPDAPPPDAHVPDAKPVGCQDDPDCVTPPDLCSLAGTCDLGTHTCSFPKKDCSSLADGCNDGACQMSTGTCVKVPTNENQNCNGGDSCGPFGACGGFATTCDPNGTETRTCTHHTCQSGACTASAPFTDTAACTVDHTGDTCSATTCGAFGACGGFTGTCGESGTQSQTCTKFTCGGGQCNPATFTQSQGCTRNTDGTVCGSPTVTNCGACTGSGNGGCLDNGTQTCTCTTFTCVGGACPPSSSSCTQTGCSALAQGDVCGATAVGCASGLFKDKCCGSTGSCSVICSSCQ